MDLINKTKMDNTAQQTEQLYDVARYFDDHFERNVATGLSMEEAIEVASNYNKQSRAYVQYQVRPSQLKPISCD